MSKIEGIHPALVTPFDSEGKFAPVPFEKLIERVFSTAEIDGIYICGSTGEGLLQPLEQRKTVTEVAVANTPKGKQVIVHTGAYRTADAIELTRHAAAAGATAISSLPPIGVYSFEEIRAYYRALSTASDLPFLVYYFPAFSPAITSLAQILELCELPNVIGLKFTDHDLYRLSRIRNTGATVFSGYDEVLAAGLLMGASGGIGTFYNLLPELFVDVWQHACTGNWQQARATQSRINELIELTLKYPVFPAVKTILGWSGIDCGPCLEPRRDLTPTEKQYLRAALESSTHKALIHP